MDTSPPEQSILLIEREIKTRRLGIFVIGLMGIWVGITMLVTGAPAFIETWFSPWSRVVLGGLAVVFGFLTVLGASMHYRSLCGWWAQLLGMMGMTLWFAAFGGGYVGLLFSEGPQWAAFGEPLSPNVSGRGYVPLIYSGLVLLSLIKVVALIKLGRPRR